jgi:hypothetical protein
VDLAICAAMPVVDVQSLKRWREPALTRKHLVRTSAAERKLDLSTERIDQASVTETMRD